MGEARRKRLSGVKRDKEVLGQIDRAAAISHVYDTLAKTPRYGAAILTNHDTGERIYLSADDVRRLGKKN